ncbi:MAG: TrkH family potassium uptake protein [Candidatus Omnitrophica bacterium]|nr:TrkH family potassium uptake protein [Candidatus Omnitrophota bacterium]
MLLRPQFEDIKIIAYYLGKILIGFSLFLGIPLILALSLGEINPALDFCIALLSSLIIGFGLVSLCRTTKDINWMQGMITVSLSWLAAMLLGAIPLYLSGHWASFLDACFDAMSGLSTTGLVLVQDLDHISYSHNLWRHLTIFIGGQGIIITVLSLMVRSASGAFRMYVGEAREERILPNVVQTARFIWIVSFTYLFLGSFALAAAARIYGISWPRSFFHGVCIFMATFDTGGFTTQSQNILYFHNPLIEMITVLIMVSGAINFNMHYAIWLSNKKAVFKDIEIRTFLWSIALLFVIVAAGLVGYRVYASGQAVFSKGFYQFISAHTTTGYSTIYNGQFFSEWHPTAIFGLILAMALGAGACSSSGGIKMLRIGLIIKGTVQNIRQLMLPEASRVSERFFHLKEMFLDDKAVKNASIVTLFYLTMYLAGTLAAMFFGFPFMQSLFESTSAAANVGLSCGITSAGMPNTLKIIYMFQMWAGRLEFMSIFVLIGFVISAIRGK